MIVMIRTIATTPGMIFATIALGMRPTGIVALSFVYTSMLSAICVPIRFLSLISFCFYSLLSYNNTQTTITTPTSCTTTT